jgi:hypothetical protein
MTTEKQEFCREHVAHANRIERCESDIQRVWSAIDTMRMWVIVGMASLVVQMGMKLLDVVK